MIFRNHSADLQIKKLIFLLVLLLSMLKTVVLFKTFVETVMFNQTKVQHLFEKEIFINVFNVTFD